MDKEDLVTEEVTEEVGRGPVLRGRIRLNRIKRIFMPLLLSEGINCGSISSDERKA